MIVDSINNDLKAAMLAGDKPLVEVLKGIKTAIQYLSVSKGAGKIPSEDEIINTLKKEQKKRSDAAALYLKASHMERFNKELYEKKIIDKYLPPAITEKELLAAVDQAISKLGGLNSKNMGQVIGMVKQICGPAADGAAIAQIVREKL